MSQQIIREFEKSHLKKNVPELKPGMTIRVHQKLKEGDKERIQVFEGLVIKINSGSGVSKTFTVRKVVEGIGVEKIYPFHVDTVSRIEIVKKAKVRRAKLYYLRKKSNKTKLYEELGYRPPKQEEAPKEEVAKEEVAKEKAAA